MESVSPELVLIDPELRLIELARLQERARLDELERGKYGIPAAQAGVEAIRLAWPRPLPEPSVPEKFREFLRLSTLARTTILAFVGLAFGGYATSQLIVAPDSASHPVARASGSVPRETSRSARDAAQFTAPVRRARSRSAPAPDAGDIRSPGKGEPPARNRSAGAAARGAIAGRPTLHSLGSAESDVEQRILTLLVAAPPRKLPAPLVDRRTGLPNNVQVICHRAAKRSFACVARPMDHAPSEGLYVSFRLRRSGTGVFIWHGYRARRSSPR